MSMAQQYLMRQQKTKATGLSGNPATTTQQTTNPNAVDVNDWLGNWKPPPSLDSALNAEGVTDSHWWASPDQSYQKWQDLYSGVAKGDINLGNNFDLLFTDANNGISTKEWDLLPADVQAQARANPQLFMKSIMSYRNKANNDLLSVNAEGGFQLKDGKFDVQWGPQGVAFNPKTYLQVHDDNGILGTIFKALDPITEKFDPLGKLSTHAITRAMGGDPNNPHDRFSAFSKVAPVVAAAFVGPAAGAAAGGGVVGGAVGGAAAGLTSAGLQPHTTGKSLFKSALGGAIGGGLGGLSSQFVSPYLKSIGTPTWAIKPITSGLAGIASNTLQGRPTNWQNLLTNTATSMAGNYTGQPWLTSTLAGIYANKNRLSGGRT